DIERIAYPIERDRRSSPCEEELGELLQRGPPARTGLEDEPFVVRGPGHAIELLRRHRTALDATLREGAHGVADVALDVARVAEPHDIVRAPLADRQAGSEAEEDLRARGLQ